MRVVVQRVASASVTVDEKLVSEIGKGLLLFHAVAHDDNSADLDYLTNKVANLRVFEDDEGRMNRSLLDIGGEALVVSQFTLYGDCRKGRRPSFIDAAAPDRAEALYQQFIQALSNTGVPVKAGIFQAMMDVKLVNDGPVTILLDSSKLF
ncbi:MAG: D-aminoacyl-tRNA deacylase [Candidatus Poribacteria bacterium]|nr:D-aminoacyl-tRNA deacylase [Candidatus Poribacteria bacterium]MDE0503069.1 D-aminoacyl-tRNA deacylase [Candidatus Poribacteria bacterium]